MIISKLINIISQSGFKLSIAFLFFYSINSVSELTNSNSIISEVESSNIERNYHRHQERMQQNRERQRSQTQQYRDIQRQQNHRIERRNEIKQKQEQINNVEELIVPQANEES